MIKKDKKVTILGIETSCDETAAAIVCYDPKTQKFNIKSHALYSQISLHRQYGGVYPELASRDHVEKILPIINESLTQAKITNDEIDAIAVTAGPGLIGSLLIGTTVARTLAYLWQKPLISINHLEGHIYSNLVQNPPLQFPMLGLIISGGHTLLIAIDKLGSYKTLGQTLDDAVGEAFDKVAKLLGLDYPGGPALSKLADNGDKNAFKFPLPLRRKDSLDFSFSGLKTSVLYLVRKLESEKKLNDQTKADICASFQATAVKSLITKTLSAVEKIGAKTVIIGGGVSANKQLRQDLEAELKKHNITLIKPVIELCTDNAVGIGAAGAIKFLNNDFTSWKEMTVNPNAKLN